MAEKKQQKSEGWGLFVTVTLLIALLAIWAFTPAKIFESTWRSEQHQVIDYGGTATNEWILSQSMSKLGDFDKSANDSIKGMNNTSAVSINVWLMERIEASVIWANLIAYRIYIFVMWVLLGMPLVAATAVDGFYTREIYKDSFISQSPIKHKMGVKVFHLVNIALVAWLITPLPMPFILLPGITIVMAMSLWFWVSNLQKRL